MTPAVIRLPSAGTRENSTPRQRELDHALAGLGRGGGGRYEREDRAGVGGQHRRGVLPRERKPHELLEPGHLLRIARRPQAEMEMWPGRVAGRAHEPEPLAGGE